MLTKLIERDLSELTLVLWCYEMDLKNYSRSTKGLRISPTPVKVVVQCSSRPFHVGEAMVVGFVDNLALVVVDAKMDLNEPISAIIAVAADSRV